MRTSKTILFLKHQVQLLKFIVYFEVRWESRAWKEKTFVRVKLEKRVSSQAFFLLQIRQLNLQFKTPLLATDATLFSLSALSRLQFWTTKKAENDNVCKCNKTKWETGVKDARAVKLIAEVSQMDSIE